MNIHSADFYGYQEAYEQTTINQKMVLNMDTYKTYCLN